MNLSEQVAIVTGAAVRLGRAIALSLAKNGCKVCVHYNNSADEAQSCVTHIHRQGGRAVAVQADLSDPHRAAEKIFSHAEREFGPPAILINSAAIFEASTTESTDEDLWDRHLTINLKAPFFLSREFAERLGSGHSGHIINIVDWRALRPATGHLAYSVAKSALAALTKQLALDLAPRIQVNAVAPGAILPPPDQDEEYFRQLAERVPLKRTGSPADVCQAVLYLLQSDFCTGEILSVAGGEQL